MAILTNNLGFPRIGAQRELKAATEAYWKGDLPAPPLLAAAATIRQKDRRLQQEQRIALIPSNDFRLSDRICVLRRGVVFPVLLVQGSLAPEQSFFISALVENVVIK